MTIIQRPFDHRTDLDAMAELANEFSVENMHVVDLPYRFSSWAMDHRENVRLWFDGDEKLIGWAVMQTPFWTIDYAFHPAAGAEVHPQILRWADKRAAQIVDTPAGRPIWFINVFTRQEDRIRDLEEAGFASQANVGENSWTKVLMQQAADMLREAPALPDGFHIRPLAGEDEVDAYVDMHREVFQSTSMTSEWRTRTLKQPAYIADLDLVVTAPNGTLAGFCICWLNRSSARGVSGQVEPLGIREPYRNLGIGKSLLTEGLRRLQAHGAQTMFVETDNDRDEAFMLYESVGYRVLEDVLVYRKDYAPL